MHIAYSKEQRRTQNPKSKIQNPKGKRHHTGHRKRARACPKKGEMGIRKQKTTAD
jgi:hypothetical protein